MLVHYMLMCLSVRACVCVCVCVCVWKQVAQEGMREPWSLEVFDFAGRMHAVNLEPGELVYYEVCE